MYIYDSQDKAEEAVHRKHYWKYPEGNSKLVYARSTGGSGTILVAAWAIRPNKIFQKAKKNWKKSNADGDH